RRREQVNARRHQLAKLHERGPQLLQRHAQALRRLEAQALGGRRLIKDLPGALDDVGDADPPNDVSQAVPDEDRSDDVEARDISQRADRFPQHQPAPPSPGPFSFFGARSASARPPRTPLATMAQRWPNSLAVSSPTSAASNEATVNFCAKSLMTSATSRPVEVPVCRAERKASRSSGPTFVLAASATCVTVDRKSSSILRRLESAALRSWSENERPVAVSSLSATRPASVETRR